VKNATGAVNVLLLIQGVAVSCLLLVVFALIIALITYITPWQYTKVALMAGNYASVTIGAVYIGRKLKQRYWLHGLLLGVIFLTLMTVVRGDPKLVLQWFWVRQLVVVSLLGILGSMCGGMLQR